MSKRIDPELLRSLPELPLEEQKEILSLLDDLETTEKKERARSEFMGFVNFVWPAFIQGRHHKIMANAFERVAKGELKRLIINMPPRHTKSEFASYIFPPGLWACSPKRKLFRLLTPPT